MPLVIIWKAAIRPILTYGINCINVSAGDLDKMEKKDKADSSKQG